MAQLRVVISNTNPVEYKDTPESGANYLVFLSPTGITTVKYGLLYNYYAASDSRHISSSDDWVIPTMAQLFGPMVYYGGSYTLPYYYATDTGNADSKMKETGTTYWFYYGYGTNEAKFNMRGSGIRGSTFQGLNSVTQIWSNTPDSTNIWCLQFSSSDTQFRYLTPSFQKFQGQDIRLLRTSTSLTHGQSGTYTGNDGKIYRTICIGTQEWLADNLVETKYRDGSSIPEVTDTATWVGLSSGALCAYNNDWNNV